METVNHLFHLFTLPCTEKRNEILYNYFQTSIQIKDDYELRNSRESGKYDSRRISSECKRIVHNIEFLFFFFPFFLHRFIYGYCPCLILNRNARELNKIRDSQKKKKKQDGKSYQFMCVWALGIEDIFSNGLNKKEKKNVKKYYIFSLSFPLSPKIRRQIIIYVLLFCSLHLFQQC